MVQPISPLHDSTHGSDLMDTSGTDDAQQLEIQNDSSMQESATPPISSSPSSGPNPFLLMGKHQTWFSLLEDCWKFLL